MEWVREKGKKMGWRQNLVKFNLNFKGAKSENGSRQNLGRRLKQRMKTGGRQKFWRRLKVGGRQNIWRIVGAEVEHGGRQNMGSRLEQRMKNIGRIVGAEKKGEKTPHRRQMPGAQVQFQKYCNSFRQLRI